MKIKVNGYGCSDGARESEILDREEIENIIDDLSPSEIFLRTFRKADGYIHSGTAYTYLDARDGSVCTHWLGSNTFHHPWDCFYEIHLCRLVTGDGRIDLDTVEDLLDISDDEEMNRWKEFDGNLREFLGDEEYEKRVEVAIGWEADEFRFDDENIRHQLDELYR